MIAQALLISLAFNAQVRGPYMPSPRTSFTGMLQSMPPRVEQTMPRFFFDATVYSNWQTQPDYRYYCTGWLWTDASVKAFEDGGKKDPTLLEFDPAKIRAGIKRAADAKGPFIFDIEDLPLDLRTASRFDVERSVRKIAEAVAIAREAQPHVRIGLYSMFPARDFWTPVNYERDRRRDGDRAAVPFKQWQAANDALNGALADGEFRLSDLFDITCPSLYQFYSTEPGKAGEKPESTVEEQLAYIRQNIAEARRYGKPVYPFIWCKLHDGQQRVPMRQWFLTTREIIRLSDGVMYWDERRPADEIDRARYHVAKVLAEKRGELTGRAAYEMLRGQLPDSPDLAQLRDLE